MVFATAEQDAHRRVIIRATTQVIIEAHIHIHPLDILAGKVAGLQIDQHKAYEQVVVEHQVHIEILGFIVEARRVGRLLCRNFNIFHLA